jgi:hypothetical protein
MNSPNSSCLGRRGQNKVRFDIGLRQLDDMISFS